MATPLKVGESTKVGVLEDVVLVVDDEEVVLVVDDEEVVLVVDDEEVVLDDVESPAASTPPPRGTAPIASSVTAAAHTPKATINVPLERFRFTRSPNVKTLNEASLFAQT